jgi:hypothetical protein
MQNATFQTFENIGLDYAAQVESGSATLVSFENIGFDYTVQLLEQNTTYVTFENIGLGDIPHTLITHNPHGWGMVKGVPITYRTDASANATFQTFENIS